METEALREQVLTIVKAQGAHLVGFAPVDRFAGAPRGHHPAELLPGAKTVVVFGVRLLDRVLAWPELLADSPYLPAEARLEVLSRLFYRRSGYDIVNNRLDQIALSLANHLEVSAGWPSLFFPAVYGEVPGLPIVNSLPGMLSLRHAAVRAGLGEFGLNNVVVTPEYGPRVRWSAVITTAEIDPSPLLREKACLGTACNRCQTECPVAALSLLSEAEEDRLWLLPPARTNWTECRTKRTEAGCTGRCLRVCPVGS